MLVNPTFTSLNMFPFEFSKANELRLYRINVCVSGLTLAEDNVIKIWACWSTDLRTRLDGHQLILSLELAEFLFTFVLPTFLSVNEGDKDLFSFFLKD